MFDWASASKALIHCPLGLDELQAGYKNRPTDEFGHDELTDYNKAGRIITCRDLMNRLLLYCEEQKVGVPSID